MIEHFAGRRYFKGITMTMDLNVMKICINSYAGMRRSYG